MSILKQLEELSEKLESLTPEQRKELSDKIQAKKTKAIARAQEMRAVYKCCPAHGEPIWKVGKTRYDLWGITFEFDTIECGRRQYCNADISNDPELLELLAQRTPLSYDKLFSSKPESDLRKATMKAGDLCPYCGKKGGKSLIFGYFEGLLLPRTLTKRKMNCGHEYALVYHIS